MIAEYVMKDIVIEILKYIMPFVVGGSVGGFIGFKIGVNKSIRQTQKGRDNAVMVQTGEVRHG